MPCIKTVTEQRHQDRENIVRNFEGRTLCTEQALGPLQLPVLMKMLPLLLLLLMLPLLMLPLLMFVLVFVFTLLPLLATTPPPPEPACISRRSQVRRRRYSLNMAAQSLS